MYKGAPFFKRYKKAIENNPAKKDSSSVKASHDFLDNAKILFAVECRLCGGWGHTMEHCGSYQRVRAARGSDSMVEGWIREATKTNEFGRGQEEKDMLALKDMPNLLAPGYIDKGKLKPGVLKGMQAGQELGGLVGWGTGFNKGGMKQER